MCPVNWGHSNSSENHGLDADVQNQTIAVFQCITSLTSTQQAATPNGPWVQVLDTQDMDHHALAQQGWALQYEQLSPGQFKGRIHQVQLPGVTLLREDTSIALRQRGRLDDSVYGFAMALQDSHDLFFNGQRVPAHAIMCGKGDEVDLTTPPHFTLIAVVVNRRLLNPLWERMYQKPLAHWLEKQLVLELPVPMGILVQVLLFKSEEQILLQVLQAR